MQNDTKPQKSLSNEDLEALADDALAQVAGGANGLDLAFPMPTAPVLRIKPGLINGIPEDFLLGAQQMKAYY